ncbi:hypothetical protein ZIOFF_013894 [Zingiber officinale]|uniref:Poly(A) polymerase nucleotidyltransferase domain-containing protein n=1 Tax=Zingiber officinale TaxID=94328 RepID=A0A8J5H9T5_ZINOF|nr:hypothetical protein ZIOFF_013894 [Zingiber officinale]
MSIGSSSEMGSAPPPTSTQYGITKPISTAGPTEVDLKRTAELERLLVDAGLYASKEESTKREEVLQELDNANLPVRIGHFCCIQIQGMFKPADMWFMDLGLMLTLCVGPSYVNQEEDFFIILHDLLAEMEEVSELHPVPDAHVPVLKFKFLGISIDLLYANISQLVIPLLELEFSYIGNCPESWLMLDMSTQHFLKDLDISHKFVLYIVDEATVGSIFSIEFPDHSQILEVLGEEAWSLDFLELLTGHRWLLESANCTLMLCPVC